MAQAEEGDVEPLAWWTYVGVGVLWFASNSIVSAAGVTGEAPYLWIAAAFVATFGAACMYNGEQCGALHCRISGPTYIGVALLAVASALGLVDISRGLIMGLFVGVFVASYALEYALASRDSTPS